MGLRIKAMPAKLKLRPFKSTHICAPPVEPGRIARFFMREFPHKLPLNRWVWGLVGGCEYLVSLFIYCLCMGVDGGLYQGIATQLGHKVDLGEALFIGYFLLLLYLIALVSSVWRRSFGFTKYYMLLLGAADLALVCTALGLAMLTQRFPMLHDVDAQAFASCVCCTLFMSVTHLMRYICARRYGYFSFIASCILWKQETPAPARRSLWRKLTHPGALGLIALFATIPAHPKVHFTPRVATYCVVVNLSQESISLLGIDELAAADPRFSKLWTEPHGEAEVAGVYAPRTRMSEYHFDAIPFSSPELTLHWARVEQPLLQQTSRVPLQGNMNSKKRNIILIYHDGMWYGMLRDDNGHFVHTEDFARLLPAP